jgi:hypothetical protein
MYHTVHEKGGTLIMLKNQHLRASALMTGFCFIEAKKHFRILTTRQQQTVRL